MNRGNDPNPFDEEEPEVNPFSVTAFSNYSDLPKYNITFLNFVVNFVNVASFWFLWEVVIRFRSETYGYVRSVKFEAGFQF